MRAGAPGRTARPAAGGPRSRAGSLDHGASVRQRQPTRVKVIDEDQMLRTAIDLPLRGESIIFPFPA